MVDSNNGVTLKVNARGRIDFTDDDTDVRDISSGGRITIERREGGVRGYFATDVKRFEAHESNGKVVRKFVFNGREIGESEGRAWLASFLPQRLREMGFNADRRVARLLAKGGPALVLTEIASIPSDFSASRHLRELYKQATLDESTLTRSFRQASRDIESDFELRQALTAAAGRQPIDQALPAFVEASRSIQSDFEQRQALAKAIERPGLSAATAGQLFKAATPGPDGSGIDSDFELAQLLQGAAKGGHVTETNVQAFIAAARHIESGFERRRVVDAMANVSLSDAAMADVVGLASSINSDFEKSQALVRLSRNANLGTATRKALADAAMGIDSEFERGRALNALTRAGVMGAQ